MRRTKHNEDSRLFFDWLEIAARDLLTAKLLLNADQCFEIAGFHCQQCLEKSFKAYLIHTTGILVDGHNLTWLCRQAVKQDAFFRGYLDECAELNRMYIEARYPSDREIVLDAQDLTAMIRTTEEVMNAVCERIYPNSETSEE